MQTLAIAAAAVVAVILMIQRFHQEVLFGRMIKQNEKVMQASSERITELVRQNNILMDHADKRLDRANQIVHELLEKHTTTTNTLSHSADSLAASISHLKDMMVHLETVYTERNNSLSKNYDQLNNAHVKLTARYIDLENKYDDLIKQAYGTLQELARRPTTTNNNNNNLGEQA